MDLAGKFADVDFSNDVDECKLKEVIEDAGYELVKVE